MNKKATFLIIMFRFFVFLITVITIPCLFYGVAAVELVPFSPSLVYSFRLAREHQASAAHCPYSFVRSAALPAESCSLFGRLAAGLAVAAGRLCYLCFPAYPRSADFGFGKARKAEKD